MSAVTAVCGLADGANWTQIDTRLPRTRPIWEGYRMRDIRMSFVLPLIFLGGVVPAPVALGQSAGTFTAMSINT
jgi:hypothetical protein